jgi:hypothetical protein
MPPIEVTEAPVWFGRSVSLPFVVSAVEPLVGVFDARGVTTSLDPLFLPRQSQMRDRFYAAAPPIGFALT